jgi:hypothetical protein
VRCRARRTLMGLEMPFETFTSQRSRYSVHGTRLVVCTTTRSFADSPADAGAPTASMGFLPPFRVRPDQSRRNLERFRRPSWGLSPLQRPRHGRASRAGLPTPTRSAFRVSRPLDGLLPPASPSPWDWCRSWGSPCRAFPLGGAVRLSAPLPSCRFRHRVLLL